MKSESKIPFILGQYRAQLGLTGKEVVALLKERNIELSEKTLLGYENGVGTPKVNTFMALCDIYHISNIMGEFGYNTAFPLATGENEWSYDLYNDFFNATLLEKIYILLREGVPSFAGYEDQLEQSFPSDANAANYDRLYKIFAPLDEPAQSYAFEVLNDIFNQRYPNITKRDFSISASPYAPKKALESIAKSLNALNAGNSDKIELIVDYAKMLEDKYVTKSIDQKIS